jgi:hypothetical protein
MQISGVACVDKVFGVSLILRLAPGDVMRSLSGIPLISIVYRGGVESWHPPISSPPLPSTNNRYQHPSPLATQSWDMGVVEIVENCWELGE